MIDPSAYQYSSLHHIFSSHPVEYHWACIETSHQIQQNHF
ncbi:hypothetical protein BQ1740_1040 [Bacillus subtilis]|nr:hypothetical protein BQ1740_1040 [Bacillus subtilis]